MPVSDPRLGEFRDILEIRFTEFQSAFNKLVEFYRLVLVENERQNLTRLLQPIDFFEGHLLDCMELLKTEFLQFPAVDLGSGAGVPGMICSILAPGQWHLVDSELRKTEFLRLATHELDLKADVFHGRIDEFMISHKVQTICCRAVGKVEKIYAWIGQSSTWNNLVLLKGPAWQDEWAVFQSGKDRKRLILKSSHEYTVGAEAKKRVIVNLVNVPRGTKSTLQE